MSLNMLFVLIILGGWLGGKVFSCIQLPNILGMTLWGIGLAFFLKDSFPSVIWELAPFLKSIALIVILLRAGLGIQKEILAKVGFTSIKMAFIPCVLEGLAVAVICRYFLLFSWPEAGMMGFILAAVSPAVVVPSMLDLNARGIGQENQTPTLILAGASLENVIAISIFSIFINFYQQQNSSAWLSLIEIPYGMIVGMILGLGVGLLLSWFFKKKYKTIRATEKVIVLLGCCIFLVQIGTFIHISSLLAIMTIGFILLERSESVAHEVALKLGKIWILAEIILFVLIGMAVDVQAMLKSGWQGLLIIMIGILFRFIGVTVSLYKTKFNRNERFFCLIAYIPKATVQAALGAIPLLLGVQHGEVILSIAVLSICLTAPVGLLGIRYFGPRLLSKQDLS